MIDELKTIALTMGVALSEADINAIYISYLHLLVTGQLERAVELYLDGY